jgi:hypothetical protein
MLVPFKVVDRVAGNEPLRSVPAGELVDGVLVFQKGGAPASNLIAKLGRHLCFGIQFATYERKNRGKLKITWRQGEHADHWFARSAYVKDNEFKYFCPRKGIAAGQEFEIAMSSVGIKSGHAPTAWLTEDTRLGTAMINGIDQKASLSLRFASYREVTLRHILSLDRGAYIFGWLISVLIGVAAIMAVEPSTRPPA